MRVKYQERPPTIAEVMEDAVFKNQRPYYSNYKDLFSYHKISPVFEPCLKHAQILDRELKMVKDYNREPISIRNELKLPYYFAISMGPDNPQPLKPEKEVKYRVKYLE